MIVDEVFLDRVAHDLRGELSTMLAGVHYLLRFGRDVPVPTREMLERIGGAGERLTRLLEEFDDTVWLLDAPKPLVLGPVRFKALMDEVITRSGKPAALKDARVLVDLPASDDIEFRGDEDMLTRALAYVVGFAMLRATDQEAVRVSAYFEDGVPIVCVTDVGAAVPDAFVGRVFEPFVENELLPIMPQGRRKLRLGFGLAIARSILETHGGSLEIQSSPSGARGFVLRCVLAR